MIDLGDELEGWDGIPDEPAIGYTIEEVFAMRDATWSTVPVPAKGVGRGSSVPLNALQKAGFDAIPHLSSDEDYAAIRKRVDGIGPNAPKWLKDIVNDLPEDYRP